jgi:hypothetical protein
MRVEMTPAAARALEAAAARARARAAASTLRGSARPCLRRKKVARDRAGRGGAEPAAVRALERLKFRVRDRKGRCCPGARAGRRPGPCPRGGPRASADHGVPTEALLLAVLDCDPVLLRSVGRSV